MELNTRMSSDAIFVPGRPARDLGYPGPEPTTTIQDGMLIEQDVAITLRDGVQIYTDVLRPVGDERVPALIAWSPYGKQDVRDDPYAPFPDRAGLPDGVPSRLAKFEGPDPLWWVPRGYAIVNPDMRGTWNCEGDALFFDAAEGLDIYDLVEWLAVQPWCNGKVAMSGVSYLAISQWFAAAEQPPHLAAINPWEGFSDGYRDYCFHGGIPETTFVPGNLNFTASSTQVEDMFAMAKLHPLDDEYWARKAAELEKITVPAYVVASWSDHGLHTRGTLEGFKRIGSQQKWLEVHGQKKWAHYYKEESLHKQLQFFDHFLKGSDDAVLSWPPVLIEVRERHGVGVQRAETQWPPADTTYQALYVDPATASLSREAPTVPGELRYRVPDGSLQLEVEFAGDTELTGHMKVRLWVEADGSDDMDLFVAVDKLDAAGSRVGFTYFAAFEDGPLALGWLRASHRELDEQRSTPWQPWHRHARELPLHPGEVVPVDIEILPSSTLFRAGERLRLTIAPRDIRKAATSGMEHNELRNRGTHIIHAGGNYDSHLLIPTVSTSA